MNNLLENLNSEQLKAVLHQDGPLLIVAGAGTGKTTVITQRIAYLIEQGLAKEDEILALTFTEKAAGEMVDRVGNLLPFGFFDLWISTFHSFAERILKEHGLAIGLPTDFKLLNEFEQWALIKKNLDKFELDYYRPLGNPTKFIHALVKHFSRAKDEDIDPRQYLEYADGLKQNMDGMLGGGSSVCHPERSEGSLIQGKHTKPSIKDSSLLSVTQNDNNIDDQEVARIIEVANAYHVYQQLLLDNNALDFGDLINYCLKLFRQRPAILEKYRRQFKYILLDEFQDTNWAQYELIKLLASSSTCLAARFDEPKTRRESRRTSRSGLAAPKNNLVAVADDDQSIFRFRGASMSNILQFQKDFPQAEQVILIKNYRSRQNILDLAYEFIKLNNPNRLEWQMKQSQMSKVKRRKLDKKLIAQNKDAAEIKILEGDSLNDEVKLVVEKIVALKEQDPEASWNDFAILVRANDSARNFIGELENAGLPYIFAASRGLYLKPVIMDVIAYLQLLDNYHESACLYRILNLPLFDFSYQELINFNWLAYKRAWSLYEVMNQAASLNIGPEVQAKIDRVLSLIRRHTVLVRDSQVGQVFLAFMADSGYVKYLTSLDEAKSREAASLLNQFMKRIQSFEAASADKSVKAFLQELDLELEAGEEGALATDLEAGPEAVRLLTVHGAKGLEFKYVFIANLVDKRFPTTLRSEQIQLPDALIKEILPQGDIHLEEERRLFYVAMTRAKQGLYFSWAKDYGGAREKKPSRFLYETGLMKRGKSEICHSRATPRQRRGSANAGPRESGNPERIISGSPDLAGARPRMTVERGFNINKLPSYFSYTQLVAFSSCPYQYRFAHILRIPVKGKEQFSFGKTLHQTLQKTFALIKERRQSLQTDLFGQAEPGKTVNPDISQDEILKLYEDCWIDEWYESKKSKAERFEQGREILKQFYLKYRDNWPDTVFIEKNFNYKLKDGDKSYLIRGTIDRIDSLADGRLRIIDYKTGRPKDKLTFEDKEQLLIYQLAAVELFKQPIAALAIYFLENNGQLDFIGSEPELEKVKTKIIVTINDIARGEFPPRPGQLCRWCDFKDICEFRQS